MAKELPFDFKQLKTLQAYKKKEKKEKRNRSSDFKGLAGGGERNRNERS
jgi:hypothetical protein